MRITIARSGSALWHACVDLARERYALDYGAAIEPAPDGFVALCDEAAAGTGAPLACAGFTYGGSRELLIDNYLGAQAAAVLSARLGCDCQSTALIEVGPLASREPGSSLLLIRMVPALCWCNGAEFLLCTVTRRLAAVLKRVGLEFVPLAAARESALPPRLRGQWGTYYDTDPVAGYIDLRHFEARLRTQPDADPHLAVVWSARQNPAADSLAGVR